MLEDRFQERMLMLRTIPGLDPVDDAGVAYLAERTRVVECKPGEVLRNEGDPADMAWILVRGAAQTLRAGQPLAQVEAPGVLGLVSVAARDPAGVGVEVVAPSRMLELPVETALELMEANFSFARNVLRNLARTLLQLRGNLPAMEAFRRRGPVPRYPDPMTLVDRVRLVREQGVFATVNMEAVIDLARASRAIPLQPGDLLWDAGDPVDRGVRIIHGQVECSAGGESVRVGDGFALGVMEIFGDLPRRYRAQVVESGRAAQFSADALLNVLEVHRSVLIRLIENLAQSTLNRGS